MAPSANTATSWTAITSGSRSRSRIALHERVDALVVLGLRDRVAVVLLADREQVLDVEARHAQACSAGCGGAVGGAAALIGPRSIVGAGPPELRHDLVVAEAEASAGRRRCGRRRTGRGRPASLLRHGSRGSAGLPAPPSGEMPSSAGASDHGVSIAAGSFLRNRRVAVVPGSTNTSRNLVVPPPVAMRLGQPHAHALQRSGSTARVIGSWVSDCARSSMTGSGSGLPVELIVATAVA